ncbi:MAG: radical SAM protein [Flavobacteriaceae bacterium]|jgi:Fe-coproporphyrin III synthase|nr:radical SAM protein [Flavobacteriaceae bacterium]
MNFNELYSNYKIFKFDKVLKALKEKEITAPIHIRIKPINICNHDCWYCAYRNSNLQLGNQMQETDRIPFEKLNEIADDIIEMRVKAVTFSGGGEPLLYKKLPLIIEKLAKAGVKVASLTNGSNLKGNMAEAFRKYGTWIRISIDGYDNESYANARGVKHNAFSHLLKNISDFTITSTKCIIGCVIIVDHNNCNHIYELCLKLKDVGVKNIKISGVITGNTLESNDYHLKIKNIVKNQLTKCKKLINRKFTIIDHYHDINDRFYKLYETCPFILYRPVIGADSNVYTCQDKAYTTGGILGSIKNVSFKEFWFSEETKKRIYKLSPKLSCKHHCTSHLKNILIHEYLDLNKDHSYFT